MNPLPVSRVNTRYVKRGFLFRCFSQFDVVVTLSYVQRTEVLGSTQGVERIVYTRQHITIGVLCFHV